MPSIEKKLSMASSTARQLINQSQLSFSTKRDYKQMLDNCLMMMQKSGYFLSDIRQLKQKHIRCLVAHWKDKELSTRTIKNKLSMLRFTCMAMKKHLVVLENKDYDLPERKPSEKMRAITDIDLKKFDDPYIRFSVALQKMFGLRREESIKFNASMADKGHHLELQASWTKGGIARDIPIRTEKQRQLLDEIKAFCGKKSLIPKEKSYIEQRRHYDDLVKQSGYRNLHGLRHAYAQSRYQTLTKTLPPKLGGKISQEMTSQERHLDTQARQIISRELGHSRITVTKIYL